MQAVQSGVLEATPRERLRLDGTSPESCNPELRNAIAPRHRTPEPSSVQHRGGRQSLEGADDNFESVRQVEADAIERRGLEDPGRQWQIATTV